MTQKFTPADLEKTVYKYGGYFERTGAGGKKPASFDRESIRVRNGPKASDDRYHQGSDENKHFVQGFNPLSFELEAEEKRLHKEDVPVRKLNFFPAGAADNIVYLPYHQKNITSTEIRIDNDPSVCYFFTDELSGCNFYIDQLPNNGNLVCHHANALGDSPADAQTRMDEQHRAAMTAFPRAENVCSLRPATYYARAHALEEQTVKGQADEKFYGGATVMGFRVAGRWQFWFQTSGRLVYRKTDIVALLKGKSKEVLKPQEVPLKIIETRRFWPQEG